MAASNTGRNEPAKERKSMDVNVSFLCGIIISRPRPANLQIVSNGRRTRDDKNDRDTWPWATLQSLTPNIIPVGRPSLTSRFSRRLPVTHRQNWPRWAPRPIGKQDCLGNWPRYRPNQTIQPAGSSVETDRQRVGLLRLCVVQLRSSSGPES
jgi:hypothetical protein